jgi:hypothetical protein
VLEINIREKANLFGRFRKVARTLRIGCGRKVRARRRGHEDDRGLGIHFTMFEGIINISKSVCVSMYGERDIGMFGAETGINRMFFFKLLPLCRTVFAREISDELISNLSLYSIHLLTARL